jgi:signal transduction histidine kinase
LFAHDLRNPLSALHSNVSYLGSVLGDAEGEAREALEDVAASSDALGHITDNLELFALALEGAKRRDAHEHSLREVLREAAQRSKRFSDSYRVRLDIDTESATDIRVIAHRDMLLRALTNLIRNSIQHAGETGSVSVRARREGGDAVLTITDSGAPPSADAAAVMFSAAGQLSSKTASGGRYSRGLGLYAAKIAAEVAGATVRPAPDAVGRFELCIMAR